MNAQNQNSLFQVSEIKVSYQPKFKLSERPTVKTSKQAYDLFLANWDVDRIELCEQFYMMLMNRANRVIGLHMVSSGGVAGTVVDPKVVFSVALKSMASYILLCHNHPSGNLRPSSSDIDLTRKLVSAGKVLDLLVCDHIIVSRYGYFSFSDEGLI